jgi:hypothetical protein
VRILNAAALLCVLVIVLFDVPYLLPRLDTLASGKLAEHLVFDLGTVALAASSFWCMFMRGRVTAGGQLQLLISLGLQMLALTAIAELGPWVPVSELGDPSDPGPSATFVYARVIFAGLLLLLLLHWSWRTRGERFEPRAFEPEYEAAPPPTPAKGKSKKAPKLQTPPVFGPDDYYEPPAEMMGTPSLRMPSARASVEPVRGESLHSELIAATPMMRQATAAILRLRRHAPSVTKKGKPRAPKFDADIVGSATCIVANRYLITAHRVLNNGEARQPDDKFYAMIAPDNGVQLFHFPVTGFALEDPDRDLAVLEIGACVNGNKRLVALPLSMREVPDGTSVLAVGYPASPVFELEVDAEGNYASGSSELKSHVNTGIVSACFPDLRGNPLYEVNFGWLPGQTGGPMLRLGTPRALFALMRDFRPIRTPDGGVIPGPYQAISLKPAEAALRQLGAAFV